VDADERAVQLYTLEYQKAAERYDNIYRSIWTIFSYMTAVAAGFLAFGKDKIDPDVLICIAAGPLLFWFWTTYLPLDRYGNEVIRRLGEIELILNRDFQVQLKHFGPYHDKPLGVFEGLWTASGLKKKLGQLKRARFAICVVFILLNVLFICEATGLRHYGQRFFSAKPPVTTAVGQVHNATGGGGSH